MRKDSSVILLFLREPGMIEDDFYLYILKLFQPNVHFLEALHFRRMVR